MVASPVVNCSARRALEAEGVDHDEVEVVGLYGYGELFTDLWDAGEDFVLVEWDVIPWPGAVAALLACKEEWCAHRFPLHRGNLAFAFGLNKFKPKGPSSPKWAETAWNLLDGEVVPVLNQRYGAHHIHEPAVAHLDLS